VAALAPRAVAANIEQLDLLPDGTHRYFETGTAVDNGRP